jgi:hypothetical protein
MRNSPRQSLIYYQKAFSLNCELMPVMSNKTKIKKKQEITKNDQ